MTLLQNYRIMVPHQVISPKTIFNHQLVGTALNSWARGKEMEWKQAQGSSPSLSSDFQRSSTLGHSVSLRTISVCVQHRGRLWSWTSPRAKENGLWKTEAMMPQLHQILHKLKLAFSPSLSPAMEPLLSVLEWLLCSIYCAWLNSVFTIALQGTAIIIRISSVSKFSSEARLQDCATPRDSIHLGFPWANSYNVSGIVQPLWPKGTAVSRAQVWLFPVFLLLLSHSVVGDLCLRGSQERTCWALGGNHKVIVEFFFHVTPLLLFLFHFPWSPKWKWRWSEGQNQCWLKKIITRWLRQWCREIPPPPLSTLNLYLHVEQLSLKKT